MGTYIHNADIDLDADKVNIRGLACKYTDRSCFDSFSGLAIWDTNAQSVCQYDVLYQGTAVKTLGRYNDEKRSVVSVRSGETVFSLEL